MYFPNIYFSFGGGLLIFISFVFPHVLSSFYVLAENNFGI